MIGIVGGGISGLAVRHELALRGVEAVVLEAAAEPGGVIRSVRSGERVLDLGPQRLRLTPPLRNLVDAVGLREELILAPEGLPLFVYRHGRIRRVPFAPTQLLGTDVVGWRSRTRMLLEPLVAWRESAGGARAGDEAGHTVASFLTRRFGREAYEAFLGPLFGGMFGSDPATMPVRHSLYPWLAAAGMAGSGSGTVGSVVMARLRAGRTGAARVCSFRAGMQQLPRALAAVGSDRVRLSTPVRSLERAPGGWRLGLGEGTDAGSATESGRPAGERPATTAGETGALSVERVVLATPAAEAARLLCEEGSRAAIGLAGLRYNRIVVVHLAAAGSFEGLGYQVAFGEGLATRGITFSGSMFRAFGREGLATAFLGGALDPGAADRSDGELGETAAREFEQLTGCAADPIRVTHTVMPAFDASWSGLDGIRLPDGIHLCASYVSSPGIAGRLRAAAALADSLAG